MKFPKSALVTAALMSALAISGPALARGGGGGGHSGGQSGGHSGGHGGWNGGWHGGWHHGHGFSNWGAFLGGTIVAGALLAPWYYPGYYGYGPYYSSYPTAYEVGPYAPTAYIEQPRAAQPAATDAGSWWYFCNETRSYYPYVRECASPWQRVAPQPPASH